MPEMQVQTMRPPRPKPEVAAASGRLPAADTDLRQGLLEAENGH